MSIEDFSGKVAVITGAGSGFGREFARLGAELGMSLVLADVQTDALQAICSELEAGGTRVLARVLDVADGAQVDALAEAAEAEFGDVHLLFNNAGVGTAGLIWENSVADWQWTLGVNLWGVIHGVRAFVPRMLEAAERSPCVPCACRQHRFDGRPGQSAGKWRLQRLQARRRVAVGDALPRSWPGHRSSPLFGAVPVFRTDRDQRIATQPAAASSTIRRH